LERAFCESGRKAGQEIDFATILETREPVTAGDGPHLVQVEDDGQVKVVGTNRGTIPGMSRSQVDVAERVMRVAGNTMSSAEAARHRTITIVESGPLRFGIWGSYNPSIIECHGWLRELMPRSGPPGVDRCHGLIRDIIWHKAIMKVTKLRAGVESSESVGYYEGVAVSSTSAIPVSNEGEFEFIVELLGPTSGVGA
jgi:hypothetical protein